MNMSGSEVLHNHHTAPHIEYAGMSRTAPHYHLWRCVAHTERPRNPRAELKPFDKRAFSWDSKAGQGGCSMRNCPGDAVMMSATLAYCDLCAHRTHDIVPCPWTSIEPCHRRLRLDLPPYGTPCPTCTALEGEQRDLP